MRIDVSGLLGFVFFEMCSAAQGVLTELNWAQPVSLFVWGPTLHLLFNVLWISLPLIRSALLWSLPFYPFFVLPPSSLCSWRRYHCSSFLSSISHIISVSLFSYLLPALFSSIFLCDLTLALSLPFGFTLACLKPILVLPPFLAFVLALEIIFAVNSD